MPKRNALRAPRYFAWCFALIVWGNAIAQDNEADDSEWISVTVEAEDADEFPGLSGVIIQRDPNLTPKPAVRVPVKMIVSGLLDEVDAVGLECELFSAAAGPADGDGVQVATGFAMAIRRGVNKNAFVEEYSANGEFSGDSIELTFIVPFFPAKNSAPVQLWTHGECQLMLYVGGTQNPGEPHTCAAGSAKPPFSGSQLTRLMACVWPGTDPKKANVSFRRPGLETFDPATGGIAEPERGTSAAEMNQ